MKNGQTVSGGYTLFRSLEEAKVPGRELAAALSVTPSAYSKWRSGLIRVPGSRLVFLTLVLADRLDTLEATAERSDPRFMAHLKSLRRGLDYQENLNRKIAQDEVQEGSRLYRKWWLGSGGGTSGVPMVDKTLTGAVSL